MSALAATLRQGLAHGLCDDPRQLADEAVNGRLQATDARLQTIDRRLQATDGCLPPTDCRLQHVNLAFNPVEPGLDGSKVVAVVPGLLQDMAGHHLLAFDLALQHANACLELLASDRRHRYAPKLRFISSTA